jgi:uracil-DNA glycosylase family 4
MRYHLSHLPEVKQAIAAAAACSTIEELQAAIMAFDAHPVCASTAMPGRAGSHCTSANPAMILGKAPAGTETETRVPFSGPAGKVLREEMQLAGLDLEACWITCATSWKARKDNTPNASQLAMSRPFLYREIELVKPAVIVCLGQKADEALTQKATTITERIGERWVLDLPEHSCEVVLTPCHAWVHYGRAERSPAFRRQLIGIAQAHPEAFGIDIALAA